MAIIRFRPDYDLYRIERDMTRLFESLNRNLAAEPVNPVWAPLADITETKDAFEWILDLPGVNPADVKITMENNTLTVSGERKLPELEGGKVHRQERVYGKYFRRFDLPQSVQTDAIKAEFKNGQLLITLPKREKAVARDIQITIS